MSRTVRLDTAERNGWIFGLQTWQAGVLLVVAVFPFQAFRSGHLALAGWLLLAAIAVLVLLVAPINGRTAVFWLGDWVLFRLSRWFGWSRFQPKAAMGIDAGDGQPDLPGLLSRLAFSDGPPFRDHGRVGLIHDQAEGRWAVTARCRMKGTGMLGEAELDRLVDGLGGLLRSLGERGVCDRLSLLVRTVPDDGQDYALWAGQHATGHAPALARQTEHELDGLVGAVAVRHEVFVTVSTDEQRVRKAVAAAGGGTQGHATVLYRELDGLAERLRTAGVESCEWLSSGQLAEAVATGFRPADTAVMSAARLRQQQSTPWNLAGPSAAPAPAARSYQHGAFRTVSYALLPPRFQVGPYALKRVLDPRSAGERRSLAVHYEVLDEATGRRQTKNRRFTSTQKMDFKATKHIEIDPEDSQAMRDARQERTAVSQGQRVVRHTAVGAVTAPSDWHIEDTAAAMESTLAGRMRLMRVDLAQDSAFVAGCLPLAIGLPRRRVIG